MTDTPEIPRAPHGTLRTRIMTEFRRAPDGLDPDDVYAYIVRLQDRIDFLEGQVREASNVGSLDATVRQAAEIRRQALEAAERAWSDIVRAADAEAARRRGEAMLEAGRLLDYACAEIRGIHERLHAPIPADTPAAHRNLHSSDSATHRKHPDARKRPHLVDVDPRATTVDRASSVDPSSPGSAEVEPPFRLPSWIEG
jgi:hypothetical protein